MNRSCGIAGLFMLASVFVFSRPVPAESGRDVFREYSSFEACYEAAKQGDAKAYEGMGDFMLHDNVQSFSHIFFEARPVKFSSA